MALLLMLTVLTDHRRHSHTSSVRLVRAVVGGGRRRGGQRGFYRSVIIVDADRGRVLGEGELQCVQGIRRRVFVARIN